MQLIPIEYQELNSIVDHFRDSTNYLQTASWLENGAYHSGRPNQVTRAWLEAYRP